MKLGDVASQLVIDPRKLTDYALNPDNPVGTDKALIFQSRLGYTRDNYESLLQQIQAQALNAEALPTQADEHGQRYQVDLQVIGVEGQIEVIRTGWIVEPGANFARLVTLYVRKQK